MQRYRLEILQLVTGLVRARTGMMGEPRALSITREPSIFQLLKSIPSGYLKLLSLSGLVRLNR